MALTPEEVEKINGLYKQIDALTVEVEALKSKESCSATLASLDDKVDKILKAVTKK